MYGEVPQEIVDKIRNHYNKGEGSLQDYSRWYSVPMDKVLEITGNTNLSQVHTIGDQVDQSELGRSGTVNQGETFDVPFDTK